MMIRIEEELEQCCVRYIDNFSSGYRGAASTDLGLIVGVVAAILSQKEFVASVLFTLALNHKQMSAYFAPAFLSHLLGKCLRRKNPLLEVSKLGLVVIGTFDVIWWSYLHSTDGIFGRNMSAQL